MGADILDLCADAHLETEHFNFQSSWNSWRKAESLENVIQISYGVDFFEKWPPEEAEKSRAN